MDNLHKPYPSKETRYRIAQDTHSTIKDVEAWFTDARKRIGWNNLRRQAFSNRKDLIIKAATHFFKPDSQSAEKDCPRHSTHFVSILASAQNLYSGELFEELGLPLRARRYISPITPNVALAALQYPSPAPSPDGFSVPLPSSPTTRHSKRNFSHDLSEDEVDVPPRKRNKYVSFFS